MPSGLHRTASARTGTCRSPLPLHYSTALLLSLGLPLILPHGLGQQRQGGLFGALALLTDAHRLALQVHRPEMVDAGIDVGGVFVLVQLGHARHEVTGLLLLDGSGEVLHGNSPLGLDEGEQGCFQHRPSQREEKGQPGLFPSRPTGRRGLFLAGIERLLQLAPHGQVLFQTRQGLGGEALDFGVLGRGRGLLEQLDRVFMRRHANHAGIALVEGIALELFQHRDLGALGHAGLLRQADVLAGGQLLELFAHGGVLVNHFLGELLDGRIAAFFQRDLAGLDFSVAGLGCIGHEFLVFRRRLGGGSEGQGNAGRQQGCGCQQATRWAGRYGTLWRTMEQECHGASPCG
ncbi:hypothetical protein Hsero_2266 [Herbaspirillum seropedicae SmR1]|uniref:Uncharacterized protein n=1 Tax=Herbaspirillum seropedicae (strain SmR1) TaxID=757424 RepID=D8IUA3_HERSS|nr:hypothetical protein Hsero_2266 [Herbaspirillum seropedicae SmR1]